MVRCRFFYNFFLRSIFRDEEEAVRVLLLLMEHFVKKTDNDLDDKILALVREKLTDKKK